MVACVGCAGKAERAARMGKSGAVWLTLGGQGREDSVELFWTKQQAQRRRW